MVSLRISLFGKLKIEVNGVATSSGLDARKVQEILSYLLIYRGKSHPRETLADVLWGENSGPQARKYLRQALWQLQTGLKADDDTEGVILADSEWVGINESVSLWTDIGCFESAYSLVSGQSGEDLDEEKARLLANAVSLYQGGGTSFEMAESCGSVPS